MNAKKLIIVMYWGLIFQIPALAVNSDLIAWWQFDESQGQRTIGTLSNQVGRLVGNPHRDKGYYGNAILFDGFDDYIDCGVIPDCSLTQQLTVSVWVKVRAFNLPRQTIMASINGIRLARYRQTSKLVFSCYPEAQEGWQVVGNTPINDNQWHHIVGIYKNSTASLYIDGKPEASLSEIQDLYPNQGSLFIGRSNFLQEKQFWNGWIDEVRIYQRALSEREVAILYNWGDVFALDDIQTATRPHETISFIEKRLRELGEWQNSELIRRQHSQGIAQALLVQAKACSIDGRTKQNVSRMYLDIIDKFPMSYQAIQALCGLMSLDQNIAFERIDALIAIDDISWQETRIYGSLILNCLETHDYASAELFLQRYISCNNGLNDRMIGIERLARQFKSTMKQETFYTLLEHYAIKEPDSKLCCAVFRHRILTLHKTRQFDKLLILCRRLYSCFPETKLAGSAMAALADMQYRSGNYIAALEHIAPMLLTHSRDCSGFIDEINQAVTIYEARTLRPQGIEIDKVFEGVAGYALQAGLGSVAAHFYKHTAMIIAEELDCFGLLVKSNKKKIIIGDHEVLFWLALVNAERGKLLEAAMIYENLIRKEIPTTFAARAYYDIARARVELNQYTEAGEALSMAASLRTCKSVQELHLKVQALSNSFTEDRL